MDQREGAAGLGVGLLGLGVVGSGVARYLLERGPHLSPRLGGPLALHRVLVRDLHKPRSFRPPAELLTPDPRQVLCDARIGLVIEVMGGERPALDYIQEALGQGKHVVTANKEVIAKHGPHLLRLAAQQGVGLKFEASVGGGIPIIAPLQRDLLANDITSIRAIINGTTNYILTKMARDGLEFQAALAQAQRLGYAEPDPRNDIEGTDAVYKLAILASLAFHTHIPVAEVYCQGITHLHPRDFRYAHELGYVVKLLAIGRKENGTVQARVHPVMLPQEAPLAKIEGAHNAIEVQGSLVGSVVFSGLGAGAWPTTSAILGDVLALAREGVGPRKQKTGTKSQEAGHLQEQPLAIKPMTDLTTRYYFRLNVQDRPGVLAQIARVLGEHQISISAVIQKDADPEAGTAELVITTHPAQEAAVQRAMALCRELAVVKEFSSLIRVESDS